MTYISVIISCHEQQSCDTTALRLCCHYAVVTWQHEWSISFTHSLSLAHCRRSSTTADGQTL